MLASYLISKIIHKEICAYISWHCRFLVPDNTQKNLRYTYHSVMVDPGLLGDVRQGQLYLQLDAIDEFDKIW